MNIIQEKVFFGVTMEQDTLDVGMAILDNGAWLLIHDNGTATGSDGLRYVAVSREVKSKPFYSDEYLQYACFTMEDYDKEPPETLPIPDTDLITLGWTTDAEKPVILTDKN